MSEISVNLKLTSLIIVLYNSRKRIDSFMCKFCFMFELNEGKKLHRIGLGCVLKWLQQSS